MRITNGMMIQNTVRNINDNLVKLAKLQAQASSQKKIEVPSDDPVAAVKSLKLTNYMTNIQQYQENAEAADSWLSYSDSALSQIGDILATIREETVEAANGTLADEDLKKIGTTIAELKDSIIEVANTSYAGRSIFAGYQTDEAPFAEVTTTIGDQVTYNRKYLSLGGVVAVSVSDSDLISFYQDNMDQISGQAELTSAAFEEFTPASPELEFSVTLDGVTQTISLADGTDYDIDTIVDTLQSQLDAAFPASSEQPDSLIKVSQDEGKIILTVQDGSSIAINSGTLDVSSLGFADGQNSSTEDTENIKYRVGSSSWVTVNAEGSDIVGEGEDGLFDTLAKLELALSGETQYKSVSYDASTGVTVETYDLDLSGLLDDLDESINRVLSVRADLGTRTEYVQKTQTRLEDNELTYNEILSQNDEVDLAEVSIDLSSAQASYQAALAAGAKVIQNSLLDYLT
ncbi:flagellar hook-associated protein 3 [Desulfosporosinus orientis DSM 765]|uniref:Flagellar hook-associated protein 3 n=1 Tax=Desulfosporosinus orientis (strain ATCC 19365 / DSM 765 / NCIMB 8382 / VKM B-1628 / Singapore I) TaxID=768706 RepID=G7WIV1_DESOD|nr:flagellar hook-associated protein FlgL [Desulfosporosinus orientis]AET69676.1 flagellar hook-associated protein 3 [Desulfosporosinus orientis DSM 765]